MSLIVLILQAHGEISRLPLFVRFGTFPLLKARSVAQQFGFPYVVRLRRSTGVADFLPEAAGPLVGVGVVGIRLLGGVDELVPVKKGTR